MTASDARQAIATAIGNDDPAARPFFDEIAGRVLAAEVNGRTIAQHLDDGAAWEAWGRMAADAMRAIQNGDMTAAASALAAFDEVMPRG